MVDMECFRRHSWCSSLGILLLAIFVCVKGQDPTSDGYINIDCGIASNSTYVYGVRGLTYASDDQYIDTGVNSNVSSQYTVKDENHTDCETLRSFPSDIKNCYTLKPVIKGLKYLVRATFYYGNYDKKNNLPCFDLYLGVNFWCTVNITSPDYLYPYEIIAIAPTNYIQVCLVNKGLGTPFINVLELRPINNTLYPIASDQSINIVYRQDIGAKYLYILRYPQDVHDRQWFSGMLTSWTAISTNTSIDDVKFDTPSFVLQTAAVPSSGNGSLDYAWSEAFLTWLPTDKLTTFFVVLHFAEIEEAMPDKNLREFYIYANGELVFKDPVLLDTYLSTNYAYFTQTGSTSYSISLRSSARATLPPILNALELYTVVRVTWLPTDDIDITVTNSIKTSYNIRKGWNGDPCVPPGLNWAGINCSTNSSNIPRITALNLSHSGLNGTIVTDFGSLIALERLDLSHNDLSGSIPGSLDKLVSLTYLDLSGNAGLSRILPPGLQKRQNDSLLTVIFESNASGTGVTGHKKSSKSVIIAAAIIVFLILGAVALFLWYLKKNNETRVNPKNSAVPKAGNELNFDKRRFSFAELKLVTNNFSDQIGDGGFGKVLKGRLENGVEVAVKLRAELSSQGIQQFQNEVETLSRVHHKNLVSLIGYCKDGDHIALVYEYIEEGNLQDLLRGSTHSLGWKQRLQIAYESGQGLEYLHKMCKPPLIHRDIKTSNILLTSNFEAKVSDFGLVRTCSGTHVSTQVVRGTPGYLDPYYAFSLQLTEKSDVYSFGVVLLEIITGKSPILQDSEGDQHLTDFVQRELSKGNIESIMDPNIRGKYNINSIWKVADLALRCVDQPARRPDMRAVVAELKESLDLEISTEETGSADSVGNAIYGGNTEEAQNGGMKDVPDCGPSVR